MKIEASYVKKIAVLRALQLGDLLCSVPALRALRQAYPKAEIHLLSLPWAKSFAARFNRYVDVFHPFPGYPGLPEQLPDPPQVLKFLQEVQAGSFDLIIQMQGSGNYVNSMVVLMGGKHCAGFFLEGEFCPNEYLFMHYPKGIHEIKRHLSLMSFLGIPATGLGLEFPLTETDAEDIKGSGLQPSGRYVCIHPGSRGSYRQWPTSYFAAIADLCAMLGYTVVLTGTSEEQPIVDAVREQMTHDAVDAAGKTSLGAIAVLLKGSTLLVSNCTGVSHLAAALETPSVVISMDGEAERWAPLNRHLHKTLDWTTDPDFSTIREWCVQALEVSPTASTE